MKNLLLSSLMLSLLLFAGIASADNVTFKVDMNYLQSLGLFDPATEGTAIRGSMTDWHSTPTNLPDWSMTDGNADLIYEGTFNVGTTSPIQYKFVIYTLGTTNIDWESDPNRQLVLTGSDQVLDPVVWEINVTFQVDMTRAEKLGVFNPATDGVSLRGNFTDWNSDPNTLPTWALTDANSDKVYSGTFTNINTPTFAYKYVITDQGTTLKKWEDAISNREDTLTAAQDVTFDVAFWDSIPPPATAISANVLFKTDVTPLLELGAFDPTLGDTLQIRGSFNGWSDSDPENSIMRQSLLSLTQYEITVPITDIVGAAVQYKFFIQYDDHNLTRPVPESGWEEPASTGGANRYYTFGDQAQQEVAMQFFNDIFIEDVIPAGDTVTVEMTAFMKCALADAEVGLAAGGPLQMDVQDPIWRFITGTPNADQIDTVFVYEDANGDSIFTLTFNLIGPVPNWFQYRLQWAGVDEEGGDTQTGGRRRVRYIHKNPDETWPRIYKMGIDAWNSIPLNPLPVETRDGDIINDDTTCVGTAVDARDWGTPKTYALKQNYPNPFNPTTTIEYSIEKAGHVNISVYNVVGQKVAQLVDGYKAAGTYSVMWNIQNSLDKDLPTGIYFYRLQAGDYKETKRMILLK